MKQQPCIYLVTNLTNGKVYVGRTTMGMMRRWRHHVWASKHKDTYLRRAIQKYGPAAFKVEKLEDTTPDNVKERETYWIKEKRSYKREIGYNLDWRASGSVGGVVSQATHAKLSSASKSYWYSMTARQRSEELRRRMTGTPKSAEHRASLSAAKAGVSSCTHKTSKYLGVSRDGKAAGWKACCYLRGKQWNRHCRTEKEAAAFYDRFTLALHGADATLNFPSKRKAYLQEDLQAHLDYRRPCASEYLHVTFNQRQARWAVFYRRKFYRPEGNSEEAAIALACRLSGKSRSELLR